MSPTGGPTLAEVVRRLDDVATRLDKLMDTLGESYVRKDVLQAMNNATDIQITGLEAENRAVNERIDQLVAAAATNRRLIVSSFIAPLVVGIVVVLILSAIGAR